MSPCTGSWVGCLPHPFVLHVRDASGRTVFDVLTTKKKRRVLVVRALRVWGEDRGCRRACGSTAEPQAFYGEWQEEGPDERASERVAERKQAMLCNSMLYNSMLYSTLLYTIY